MKHSLIYIKALLFCFSVCLVACVENSSETDYEAELVTVSLNLGASPLENEEVVPNSRAIVPMAPEVENPMKSIAVIQFDSEGTMLQLNETNHPFFHYIDLTSENNPTGQISTELNVKLYAMKDTRVCVIANVDEQKIRELTFNDAENRNYIWNEFRVNTIDIPYILEEINGGQSVGHVEEIYMFGYFEGEINEQGMAVSGTNVKQLSIAMSRLISRMEMYIKLGDGVTIPNGYRIFLGFTGIEKSAYLVPGAANYLTELVHNHVLLKPVDRTDIIIENSDQSKTSTFYFYLAPHIVKSNSDKVTRFVIWCVPENINKEDLIINEDTDPMPNPAYNHCEIMMCNDPLQENPNVEGALWLNRNSLYHVNITLTNGESTKAMRSQTVNEFVIDLKSLIN